MDIRWGYALIFLFFAAAVTFVVLWYMKDDGSTSDGFFHPRLILDDSKKLPVSQPAKYRFYMQIFGGQSPVNLFDTSTLGIVPTASHWSKPVWMFDGDAISGNFSSGQASAGLKDVAETGATDTLVAEQKAAGRSTLVADGFSPMSGVFPVAEITLTKTTDVQVVSMLAPSPDWYCYSRIQLVAPDPATHWENFSFSFVNLFDAGTDSGATASAENTAENPQKDISAVLSNTIGLTYAVRVEE